MPRLPQSEEQRDIVKRRILHAAQELFDSSGIDAVSMRALGARVGLTASALYAYFPTKTALLRALWREAFDELLARMQDISRDETDPVSAIRVLGQAYVEFALENQARYRVLFLIESGDSVADLKSGGIRHAAYDLFRAKVDDAIKQNRLKIDNPDLVAQTLWSGVHGVLLLTGTSASFSFLPPQVLAASMISALLSGLSTPMTEK